MQKDNLEQFIQDNRAEFDDARPSLKLWADIEREMDANVIAPKANRQALTARFGWLKVAAAAVLLLMVGGMGGMYIGQPSGASTAEAILDEFAPDFKEMEQYYNQQIDKKYGQLTSYVKDPELDADLTQIDEAMAELRAELENTPEGTEQQLVEELIASYRLKLQILERVLESLERNTNNDANSGDENKTSNISSYGTSI